jgi:glycosyltransferase involved in cell wall biosynthesis
LAVIDLEPALAHTTRDTSSGLTVAQLFLHADIDPSLSAAGAGDNGGIATLLVRLGDALTHEPGTVERVLTLSRGSISQATADLLDVASQSSGHVYGHVPLAPHPTPSAAAWPLRVRARRGIRRLLRAAGHIDVLHLRMADVGSLAAADVARELGIPTVFTLAPDPHGVIQSLDRAGTLTRETDLAEHFWFRTSLVRSLAGSASHSVLFPRPNLADDMRSLVGVDIDSVPERHTIVAEGVDLEVVDRAVALVSAGATDADPALRELADLVGGLAPDRRDLPLIVSVGRMHRVKGMATLAETWAGSALSERANLLIIGGDLERATRGLILAGHRPKDIAARWVAAARLGIPGRVSGQGVYVCASIKEEFGIALLEALATGMVVVAPDGGGPATYVADQDTGFLTATWDTLALKEATHRALDRAALADPAIAERARTMVAERFTIQAMAAALAPVYRRVAEQEAELVRAAGAA